ncbi:hypothetical protein LTR94_025561, partial [Friedmanniomyces endolithicus]
AVGTTLVGAGALALVGCSNADAQTDWTAADMPDQTGRRVLITGANGYPRHGVSGLGYHVALAFARAGAEVIIASRNRNRGDEAVRLINLAAPNGSIRFEPLDLADLSSVRTFSERMRGEGRPLDVLINNAGVMGRQQREVSVDGFERCFATNLLGHFALSAQLMPLLRQGRQPRIVWVASSRSANADLDFSDLQLLHEYDYANAYDQTKLGLLMIAQEFHRRSQTSSRGVASIAAHPGVAKTSIVLDGPGPDSREGFRFRNFSFLFRDPADRMLSIAFAGSDPQAYSGRYYGPSGLGGVGVG